MVLNLENYFSQTRIEMLEFIPSSCNKVLEVGCGEGKFVWILRKMRNAEVWGIDINKDAVEKAAKRLDRVLLGDIEKDIFDLPLEYFDCVVFNDVLEHLRDPWEALHRVQSFLKKDGHIVAYIPNVRYFNNIKALLKHKDWKYENEGILDKTHLRFFTIKTVRELFESSGYEIKSITGINSRIFPWKFRIIDKLFKHAFEDMKYMQFACVAQKIA